MIKASEIKDFLELLEERWYSVSGLLVAVLLSLGFEHILMGDGASWKVKLPVYTATVVILVVAWLWSKAVPRSSRGRIGIVISLSYENVEVRERVQADFIQTLRELITQGQTGPAFQVLEIPEHKADKVEDIDDAQQLRRRSRAHLFIWGRVRLRRGGDEDRYIINMNGIVSHKRVAPKVRAMLAADFSAIFPRETKIEFENDILEFDFLSAWTECVARYIVGVAFELSGLVDQAEALFRDVEAEVSRARSTLPESEVHPAIERIERSVPIRLVELAEIRAHYHYGEWRETHVGEHMRQAGEILKGLEERFRERDLVFFLLGISLFVQDRDADAAIRYFINAKKRKASRPQWHYCLAFLYAYKGELKKSIRHYREIEQMRPDFESLNQVEDFYSWILNEQPNAVQLYYCLGFVEWKIRGDGETAIRDFERFIDQCPEGSFLKEQELAAQRITEIQEERLHAA